MPYQYFAFKKYGKKPIAGPFRTRLEAKEHGPRAGRKCKYCGNFSGGHSTCWGCLCVIFNHGEPIAEPKKARPKPKRPITELFCTC